ncbi:hypothetical protein Taro_043474 [Colocasia esculenta]|uniref:Uncharacterized protein n=1 Tax=Colocasia esculenta TaxID=4460 RepID=A0A843WGK1_COLES|nr:hypothetical protein [Colocasia esculenta]
MTPMGVATWALSCRVAPSRLEGRRFKTEAAPHSPPLTLSLALLPPSFPLELPCGDVIVVLGAKRRWPFRREGPNGSALLVEVRLLSNGRARTGRRRRGDSHGLRS